MSKVLAVYGEGGHAAQMMRLIPHLALSDGDIVALVDSERLAHFSNRYTVCPLRDKQRNTLFGIIKNISANLNLLYKLTRKYSFQSLLSTGPGICILPSIIFRLQGKPVVFIETWSRFRTKSFTGRVMYYLATHFYIQNKALLQLYPKAIYSGRL